jgi:thiamine-monophosphate kinase
MSRGSEPPSAGEHAAIARWTSRERPSPGIDVGPGDDCAWIDGVAVSVDTIVQGVHFRFDWSTPEDVGWKAVCAALSDLAGSRARPRAALLALSVSGAELAQGGLADALMAGAHAACAEYACPIVGGDVTHTPGPVQLSVTVLGRASPTPLLRSGARPGDLLQRSGPTGWAALAVQELPGGGPVPPRALAAHRRPRPRLDLLPALAEATAGLDISDGLLADAAHIAARSGVELRLDRAACLAGGPGSDALALSGGEDYELLVCAPRPLPGFEVVGQVLAGLPGSLSWSDGTPVPAAARGWDHGRLR